MPFDENQYAQDFLKKHRRARTLPDDLLERYAITLPASKEEIAAQLKAVRAYWNKISAGSTTAAQPARMCKADDERLRDRHGQAMEDPKWWEARQAERRTAAQATITALSKELRQRYGELGVVTAGTVEGFAAKLSLSRADAVQAAQQAGLTLVEGVTLPESEPFAQFSALLKSMSECAARSVPEIVHPGSGTFSLIDRYCCTGSPALRLDVAAVDAQSREADKRGVSATENAHRSALKILRRALTDGVDLRDVALYHLATLVRDLGSLSPAMAATELQKAGLERTDAVRIAVLLADQGSAGATVGLAQVRSLLAAGQLNEATQAAQSMPGDSANRLDAIKEVEAARERLSALVSAAQHAAVVLDEARAAALLREAAAISAENAAIQLSAIPLPPPAALRAVCEGSQVRLFWQPAAGHDENTSYVVARSEHRQPAAASDGARVGHGPATNCTDTGAPIARTVQYGVFALAEGRPDSRPAVTEATLLPPVSQLRADLGPAEVTLHWSAEPAAAEVRVYRTVPQGAPVQVPVRGSNCFLSGLKEGEKLTFEVTAVYLEPNGRELRSPAVSISATPRSEAKPIDRLRVRPYEQGGTVRTRVAWTPVDNSEVRIRHSDVPPRWEPGTWVPEADVAAFGQELTGRRSAGRSEIAIEAELPPGVHYLAPFSAGGNGIVMGRPAAVAVTDPVRQLKVTQFASYATVSWEWPPSAQLAEISWSSDADTDVRVISEAEYRTEGGPKVPLGRGLNKIEVRAMILADGKPFSSPPVSTTVTSATEAEIRYSVSSSPGVGPFGGRSKKVAFHAGEGCPEVHVRMVAQPGRIMPDSADSGVVILDTTLSLSPGMPAEHPVTVPRSVKRPYWVRCFVVGGRARLIDPPVSSLKDA